MARSVPPGKRTASVAGGHERPPPLETVPPSFDEAKYLRTYPDVALAVQAGEYASGRHHYQSYGHAEGRLDKLRYRHNWPVQQTAEFPPHGVDAVLWTPSGRVMVIGWIDDQGAKLASMSLMVHETLLGATADIGRCRRADAEQVVHPGDGRLLGFWTVFEARTDIRAADVQIVLWTEAEQRIEPVTIQPISDERLREMALDYVASASYWGNAQVEGFAVLDAGLGQTLIGLNRTLSSQLAAGAFCRRFGPDRHFAGSIVVCLYGRPEYLFLQAALFTKGQGWQDYEFIYVSNSPELAERLFKEAALAARIYGIAISLVILAGNAGFGVANNIAAGHARSGRIMIVNPDVFPRQDDWARMHASIIESRPAEQTRLFGVPLYYDDGSLMHGGMYFELDEGFSLGPAGMTRRELARVEHYGKGAPPNTERFLRARAVPAVTGAFMSIARDWFERLGGFSPDYVFGHYEDADLCLRSRASGTPVWMQALPMWHMEGKGSTRRAVHEGGSLVNRWHFTRSWSATIHAGLIGPRPARLEPAEAAAP